jgi:hypothetical protein
MRPFQSRQVILVFVASAVAVGSLLAPEPALAELALFRVEQRWHTFPNPPVTTGHAGMDQGYLQPDTARTKNGEYLYPPPTAVVAPGNPIGGAFTLPTGFINVSSTYTQTPKTAWPGYTTIVYVDYYNGPGKFQPNFGSTASQLRLFFPTTGGEPDSELRARQSAHPDHHLLWSVRPEPRGVDPRHAGTETLRRHVQTVLRPGSGLEAVHPLLLPVSLPGVRLLLLLR